MKKMILVALAMFIGSSVAEATHRGQFFNFRQHRAPVRVFSYGYPAAAFYAPPVLAAPVNYGLSYGGVDPAAQQLLAEVRQLLIGLQTGGYAPPQQAPLPPPVSYAPAPPYSGGFQGYTPARGIGGYDYGYGVGRAILFRDVFRHRAFTPRTAFHNFTPGLGLAGRIVNRAMTPRLQVNVGRGRLFVR